MDKGQPPQGLLGFEKELRLYTGFAVLRMTAREKVVPITLAKLHSGYSVVNTRTFVYGSIYKKPFKNYLATSPMTPSSGAASNGKT